MSDEMSVAEAYRVLGLKPGVSLREARRARNKLADDCHPDKHPGNDHAAAEFRKVQSAFETIEKQFVEGESLQDVNGDENDSGHSPAEARPPSHDKLKITPVFVDFGITIKGTRPVAITVRIEQTGEAKRPEIRATSGDFWRARIIEPSVEDRRFGVLFTCTLAANAQPNHYIDSTTLVVGGQRVTIPIELVVLPQGYVTDRYARKRAAPPRDEDDTESDDAEEEEYAGDRYMWLTLSIVSLVGPFGIMAMVLPNDGNFNLGSGFISLLCAAWLFVGFPLSANMAWRAFRENKKSST